MLLERKIGAGVRKGGAIKRLPARCLPCLHQFKFLSFGKICRCFQDLVDPSLIFGAKVGSPLQIDSGSSRNEEAGKSGGGSGYHSGTAAKCGWNHCWHNGGLYYIGLHKNAN
ncbi:hypothetical protein GCM10007094_12990 [Pseudovibrio japonicus]|uniref:Uncharacterized protein n=1 Tax=Pseudovibrio japonicus TaxID=366534 RepID=A0ABQ3E606_9HYPH|nr:hypothetical protein GCM10007094_12990 [Pseudovibrio japonicus]